MQMFVEKDGRYEHGGAAGSPLLKGVMLAVLMVMIGSIAIPFFVLRGIGGQTLFQQREIAIPAMVGSVTVMALVLALATARLRSMGRVVVDMQESTISFGSPASGRRGGIAIPLRDLDEIVLVFRPAGATGVKASGSTWVVRVSTSGGEYDILVTRDREKAQQLAVELSSLTSVRLRDSTPGQVGA